MSIYNGQCDHGSMTASPCTKPATFYAQGVSAFCEDHQLSFGSKINETWQEVVERYESEQRRVVEAIELAEREGLLLWYESEIRTPAEIRRAIKNGYTITRLTVLDRGEMAEMASGYEREAEDHESEAKRKRSEARRLRRALTKARTVNA